jgi:hypothetical protein
MVRFEKSPHNCPSEARHWREESAASLLAASRFLADTPGFGMTRGRVAFAETARLLIRSQVAKAHIIN